MPRSFTLPKNLKSEGIMSKEPVYGKFACDNGCQLNKEHSDFNRFCWNTRQDSQGSKCGLSIGHTAAKEVHHEQV